MEPQVETAPVTRVTFSLIEAVLKEMPVDLLPEVYRYLVERLEEAEDLDNGTEEEIRADNEQWDRQFAASQNQLAQLADEALAEYHAGKTRPFPT